MWDRNRKKMKEKKKGSDVVALRQQQKESDWRLQVLLDCRNFPQKLGTAEEPLTTKPWSTFSCTSKKFLFWVSQL